MNFKSTPTLLLAIATFASALPLQAAGKKVAENVAATDAALVEALRAVSPDPLGGRLGLDLATARSAKPAFAQTRSAPPPKVTTTTRPVERVTEAPDSRPNKS
jgi:hypothetical protein